MVGKKKSEDVQFYMEGGKMYEDINQKNRNVEDESDDEENQR